MEAAREREADAFDWFDMDGRGGECVATQVIHAAIDTAFATVMEKQLNEKAVFLNSLHTLI